MKVAVIGAGWAGLAAAVHATQAGHQVTVYEMAGTLGGRARTVHLPEGPRVDNGQHILIGAYTHTLALMQTLGVDLTKAFDRRPLCLVNPQGQGLRLDKGHPAWAFVHAVWKNRSWSVAERWALCLLAVKWAAQGFRCAPEQTVADLTSALPQKLRDDFLDPLCIAALNTPAIDASATVFLRVLKDALLSGPGASDLLLPQQGLGSLLPEPAQRWLEAHGAHIHTHQRVQALHRRSSNVATWQVETSSSQGTPTTYDQVVLACTAAEAARLTRRINPLWSATAAALRYEPIVTVTLHCPGTRLPEPMLALASDADENPAQFVFDLGQLGGAAGELSFVISGAAPWVERGAAATEAAVLRQAQTALQTFLLEPPTHLRCLTEKRGTFRCSPNLARPASLIAPGLWAAADYVDGPYPATLEGAIRSAFNVIEKWKVT
ncbi:MAG: hydroxysqualene dehydroxylase HpnE [Burkholderiales bacterium]